MKLFNRVGLVVMSGLVLSVTLVAVLPSRADDANSVPSSKPVPYPLDTCVVSGDKLGGDMGDPMVFIYSNNVVNQEIKFCCPACKPKFLKDTDKYMKIIQDAETAQKEQNTKNWFKEANWWLAGGRRIWKIKTNESGVCHSLRFPAGRIAHAPGPNARNLRSPSHGLLPAWHDAVLRGKIFKLTTRADGPGAIEWPEPAFTFSSDDFDNGFADDAGKPESFCFYTAFTCRYAAFCAKLRPPSLT
jgi:hypothetical protein